MIIAIAPYARKLGNGKQNPKNYKYFPELVRMFIEKYPGIQIDQLGAEGEPLIGGTHDLTGLPFKFLRNQLKTYDFIISVDSVIPHLCALINKRCHVVFVVTDPKVFGHYANTNMIKNISYINSNRFLPMEQIEYNEDAMVDPVHLFNMIITTQESQGA